MAVSSEQAQEALKVKILLVCMRPHHPQELGSSLKQQPMQIGNWECGSAQVRRHACSPHRQLMAPTFFDERRD